MSRTTISAERARSIAIRVMDEGRVFRTATVYEGDGESGPYAVTYYAARLGRLFLELHGSGLDLVVQENAQLPPEYGGGTEKLARTIGHVDDRAMMAALIDAARAEPVAHAEHVA